MAMRGAVIEKLFTCGAGWFEGSSSSSSCNSPTSPLDLKFVMSPRRVHNSSCNEVASSRGIGLGIIVNMDKSRESTAILLRPSHHVNANIDNEEEYTIVTRHDHHKRNNNNSYPRKQLVCNHNCGDEKLTSLFDISPTPARVDDINAGADHFLSSCHECNKQLDGKDIYMYRGEKAFCSIECRSLEIAKMEEESMKKKMMMRNKHDYCSSSSTRNSPQQVPVSRSSGHGHGQMMSTGRILAI